mmetsp:Transcript_10591/g.35012  ORF Transcript_10591/g.35012 Transcript_10591/m.35012 type:complete len:116 (-) Transcript_10591:556-903(-)
MAAVAGPPPKKNGLTRTDSNNSIKSDDDTPWHNNDTPLVREGWGELTRLCAITDMKGCTFGSIAMPQLIPAVIQAVSIFVNYYPFIVRSSGFAFRFRVVVFFTCPGTLRRSARST